jgi:hypothetical protein
MKPADWSRYEVEVIVDDYLRMLSAELAGVTYNKAAHRRAILPLLNQRSEQSIEFKHCNISAALIEAGFPYIGGYKPRANYQTLLNEVLLDRLQSSTQLAELAAFDVDRPIVVPEVEDILAVLTERPKPIEARTQIREPSLPAIRMPTNYLEREARNRSLGAAGELFVITFEQARLVKAGKEALASRIEHTSKVRGDHEGFDILSFDESGAERLIEVKTTKYGSETPFFVTNNEVVTSERKSAHYQVYRLYTFHRAPRLFMLPGAIGASCELTPAEFIARPR